VPVLVRVSYFPNWTAHGAEGPYRIGPNQMVVVPTDTHVRLEFERTTTDLFFYGLTAIGIVLALVARFRDWNFPRLAPAPAGGMSTTPPSWPSPSAAADFDDIAWAPGPRAPGPDGEPPPPPPLSAPMVPALPPPREVDPDSGTDDRSGSSLA
jgi:hypothetical protein